MRHELWMLEKDVRATRTLGCDSWREFSYSRAEHNRLARF